jgi:hypothetical protein
MRQGNEALFTIFFLAVAAAVAMPFLRGGTMMT